MADGYTVTPISQGPVRSDAPPPPAPRPSGGRGCLFAWALLATLVILFMLLVELAKLGASAGGSSSEGGPGTLHEKVVEGSGDAKIAVIEVSGVIMEKVGGGGLFGGVGESLVKRVKDQLEKAAKDDAVKAVILDVDSPGGAVTPSDQLYAALVKFRDDPKIKKPLVVHQGALAASGGYYISAAGDEIWAEPTTITGSIGVILGGTPNIHDFLEEHKIHDMTITSGPNKDLLSPTSKPRDSHREILQATVDDMYARFCQVVAEGIAHRTSQKVEDVLPAVKTLADGRIYTSKQAKELKLVDGIGYFDDAFAAAKKRANVTEAKLVRYRKEPNLAEIFGGGDAESRLSIGGVTIRIDQAALADLETPRFLMLWRGQ